MSKQKSGVEKTLTSKMIYDGRVIKLHLDTIELPDGNESLREVIKHPGAVAIVPVTAKGNILMVTQYRYAVGKMLLEVPAGTLNPHEAPETCAIREMQEETGFKPGKIEKIGGIFTAPGYTSEFIHFYLATDLIPSRLKADDDEFVDVEELPLKTVLEKIASGEIADGKTVSAILLVKDRLSKV